MREFLMKSLAEVLCVASVFLPINDKSQKQQPTKVAVEDIKYISYDEIKGTLEKEVDKIFSEVESKLNTGYTLDPNLKGEDLFPFPQLNLTLHQKERRMNRIPDLILKYPDDDQTYRLLIVYLLDPDFHLKSSDCKKTYLLQYEMSKYIADKFLYTIEVMNKKELIEDNDYEGLKKKYEKLYGEEQDKYEETKGKYESGELEEIEPRAPAGHFLYFYGRSYKEAEITLEKKVEEISDIAEGIPEPSVQKEYHLPKEADSLPLDIKEALKDFLSKTNITNESDPTGELYKKADRVYEIANKLYSPFYYAIATFFPSINVKDDSDKDPRDKALDVLTVAINHGYTKQKDPQSIASLVADLIMYDKPIEYDNLEGDSKRDRIYHSLVKEIIYKEVFQKERNVTRF